VYFYKYRHWDPCDVGCLPPPTNLDIDHPEFGEVRLYMCDAFIDKDEISINGSKYIGGEIEVVNDFVSIVTGSDDYRWHKKFIKIK